MIKFTALVIAVVLAPGLQSAVVTREEITNYPFVIDPFVPETRPLPLPVYPEVVPEIPAVVPELRPEVIPEVTPELRPLPEIESPCEACFSYMSSLIDQLTETVESSPQLPEYVPEGEVPVVNRPLPVFPEVPVVNRPLPVFPEEDVPVVDRPAPAPASPEEDVPVVDRPAPAPVYPEEDVPVVNRPAPALSESQLEIELAIQDRPLPEYIIRR